MEILQLEKIKAIRGDCMDYLRDIPDKYYDLAIVDPEYGIKASKKKKYHDGAFTQYIPKDWDMDRPSVEYFAELFRVSKNQIIWGANYFVDMLPIAKNWIVWDKSQPLGISFSMHELAFCSCEGQAVILRVSNGENGNRCTIKEKSAKYQRIHPTQKPVKLYKMSLDIFAKKGDKILDTHGGSFSHAIACHDLGFDLTIIEKDEDYFNDAVKRLKWHQRQQTLQFI